MVKILKLFFNENGMHIFWFQIEMDVYIILKGGPWLFKGLNPLVLRHWSPRLKLDPTSLQCLPVWVAFPSLDLQFCLTKMLSKITSLVGKPYYVDKLFATKERLSYARVLIEVNVAKKLKEVLMLKGLDGRIYE